jgi:hypothetical protein
MKRKVGLWIDQKNAVIFSLADEGAEIKRIASTLETHEEKPVTSHLNDYYDEVLAYIRTAESILIFGPGEAKAELQKRLEYAELHEHIVGIETADKMTDNQIVTKIRQHFLG